MQELFFVFDFDTSISRFYFSNVPACHRLFCHLPPCIAVTKDPCAEILSLLYQQPAARSSCVLLRTANAEYEDMESIPRCGHRQLAYRLHSIWRSCCTVPDRKTILSKAHTIDGLMSVQFHEKFVTNLGWIDEAMVRPFTARVGLTTDEPQVPTNFCY